VAQGEGSEFRPQYHKKKQGAKYWLMPVILVTLEAKIGKIKV
jgi:hypothetical protein